VTTTERYLTPVAEAVLGSATALYFRTMAIWHKARFEEIRAERDPDVDPYVTMKAAAAYVTYRHLITTYNALRVTPLRTPADHYFRSLGFDQWHQESHRHLVIPE